MFTRTTLLELHCSSNSSFNPTAKDYHTFSNHASLQSDIFMYISDLEPNTEYEVRMKAATQVGFKPFQDSEWPWVPVRTHATPGT